MARVVVVCGYDRFSDLDEYAGQVAARLRGGRIDAVIASGGFTNAFSDHSEAWLMSRVLESELPGTTVLLEERAMNTLDNLVHSLEIARARFGRVESLEVFCGKAHRLKVLILARLLWGRSVSVSAVDREVGWMVPVLEPFSIAIETLAVVVRPLRPLLSHSCAVAKGVSAHSRRSTPREDA